MYNVYIKYNERLSVTNCPKKETLHQVHISKGNKKDERTRLSTENSAAVIMTQQANEKKIHFIVTVQHGNN
jgi:hypothetical protein